jgi:hypothetical protein
MSRGGARPGSGRKVGSVNKLTKEAKESAAEGLTPLDFMLKVLRNEDLDGAARMDAAKAAAPYVHAKLANVEVGGKGGGNIVVEIVRFSDQAPGE